MKRTSILSALVLAAACLSALPARAQDAPPVQNPCADSLYQSLKGKALNQLTEREYQYFIARERACTDYLRLAALVDRPAGAPPAPRGERLHTSSRTQVSTFGEGVDVYIRNDSPVPIIVNSVRVYDCENIRHSSCATHHPKTRIPPNQERRVLTIRYQPESNMPSTYRLEYLVSAAEQ